MKLKHLENIDKCCGDFIKGCSKCPFNENNYKKDDKKSLISDLCYYARYNEFSKTLRQIIEEIKSIELPERKNN